MTYGEPRVSAHAAARFLLRLHDVDRLLLSG